MDVDNSPIVKKILYAGTKSATFNDGTKVFFHFQTRLCNEEKTLLDDSKKMGTGKPLELVLGKKFKLEVWEAIVQKMSVNEVAQFTVDKNLVLQYPFVSKTLRDANIPREERRSHCCAMTLQNEGVGYDDLTNFLKNPCNLEFTIELVDVQQPEDYTKETWQMNEDEKLKLVPQLKEQGNKEFKNKNYKLASDSYAQAIGILEQLMLKEKPHDDEWNSLNKQKVPLLLNYSQCKLLEDDFYSVIEHCSTVLTSEPDNVKALFRRGKAHIGAWNPDQARKDLMRVIDIDPTLKPDVMKEILKLDENLKIRNQQDKEKLKNLFNQ